MGNEGRLVHLAKAMDGKGLVHPSHLCQRRLWDRGLVRPARTVNDRPFRQAASGLESPVGRAIEHFMVTSAYDVT